MQELWSILGSQPDWVSARNTKVFTSSVTNNFMKFDKYFPIIAQSMNKKSL